jgi:ubiquinone biosynthesis protein
MIFREWLRLYTIGSTLLTYGLDDLIPAQWQPWPARLLRRSIFWLPNRYSDRSRGARLRLALEHLGPVFIKFGQMLSTRRDLLPPDIADELALLQDQVKPFDGYVAKGLIEKALGASTEVLFTDFDVVPLASASIAQVHTATLREDGEKVVIKVIRPDIKHVIDDDLHLMMLTARLLATLLPNNRLRLVEVVDEYRRTLVNELNLMSEAANAIQLRRNFADSKLLYVPKMYSDLCRENVLVMERIYGIPVSDRDALIAHGVNLQRLAERGVEVFFTQVFRDSFFHADMHPGNVFVSYEHPDDPLWIGIDCGIVGTLNRQDKRYLAENFLAFFNRDYHKVAELHVQSGWVPADTKVEEFESAIRTVLEPIFAKPLIDISFGQVLLNLFNTARRFNMQVQPQLVLLQKTLLYIEGLGRQLYPQLDLWKTAKPFLERWMRQQIGVEAAFHSIKEKAPFWLEKLPEIPDLIYDALNQVQNQHLQIQGLYQQYKADHRHQAQGKYLFGIGATLLLGSIWLLPQHHTLAQAGFIVSVICWCYGWWKVSRRH